jgi:predicted DNA-binding transcriptional regulator YafY
VRTFRVSRVGAVRPLGEPAHRPDGFDLAAQWAESSAAFVEAWPTVAVRVRAQAEVMWHLRDVLEPGAAQEALAAAGPADAEGWRETTARFESVAVAQHELLRFGSRLEVLDPPELREAMAAESARMAARYALA